MYAHLSQFKSDSTAPFILVLAQQKNIKVWKQNCFQSMQFSSKVFWIIIHFEKKYMHVIGNGKMEDLHSVYGQSEIENNWFNKKGMLSLYEME